MPNRTGVFEVDPIPRIEGHLGVKVTSGAGGITSADVHGNLWRGFENFLLGRAVNDAITFTQRICGVCPVPHGMTSTYAADAVLGYSRSHITFAWDAAGGGSSDGFGVPKKAVHIRNLVLAAEFLMSSITHFYHLAAPSYVQGPAIPPWTPWFATTLYAAGLQNPGGNTALPRTNANGFPVGAWDAVILSYVKALRIRRLTFEAGALFAGRMPMTSCYVGGGVTDSGTEDLTAKCNKFKQIISEVGAFIVQEYVPIALALGALYTPFDNADNGGSGYGAGLGRFIAWGAFPSGDDTSATAPLALPGGLYDAAAPGSNFTVLNKAEVYSKFLAGGTNAVPTNLTESIARSRYDVYAGDAAAYTADGGNAAYPGAVSRTKPNRTKTNAYSYMKAPRWNGQACEVGPFARLVVAGFYPVDGRTLATVVPGYTAYVKTNASAVTGLDPKMVSADLAVGLVNSGLATLTVGAGAPITNLSTTARDAIIAAYTDPEAVITGTVAGWVSALQGGLSTMDRLRARALESLVLVQAMIGSLNKTGATLAFDANGWTDSLKGLTGSPALDFVGSTWRNAAIPVGTVQGWGATEAPRGALMHQCTITAGKITKYQCIVPTTWNGSPKDAAGNPGAFEQALIGVPFDDTQSTFQNQAGANQNTASGIEVLRVLQSFDPCIACAVH